MSGFWPPVTTAGTAVGETVKVTVQVRPFCSSGAVRSRVAPGGTATRPTVRPPSVATTVCASVKSEGSLWRLTVTAPPVQSRRVYDAVRPDHVSCG